MGTTTTPTTDFDALLTVVTGTDFGVTPPVSVDEAREFRRLYTVGNYVLAKVPQAVASLNTLLNTSSPAGANGNGSTLPLQNRQALLNTLGTKIDRILNEVSQDFRNEAELLAAARAQFDIGTAPAQNVNAEFKTLFRNFVGYCANDLLAVDPVEAAKNAFWDQQKTEELLNFLKRTRRSLIRLVESMSVAGTLGSAALVAKWSKVLTDSLDVLRTVGTTHVATDDIDRKHIWSVVAELNRQPRASISPYVVHAREGGQLLSDAIDVYDQIRKAGALEKEDKDHLRELFFDSGKFKLTDPAGKAISVSEALRRNATLLQENWIPAWS